MKRNLVLLSRVTVFVVVTMLLGALPATALAQRTKGKGGKSDIYFETYKDKSGKYRYRLKNKKGKSLAIANSGIKTQAGLKDYINTIQKYAAKAKVVEGDKVATSKSVGVTFQLYKNAKGQYRYRILSNAGTKLGRSSVGFKTKAAAQAMIDEIQRGALTAKVMDKSK